MSIHILYALISFFLFHSRVWWCDVRGTLRNDNEAKLKLNCLSFLPSFLLPSLSPLPPHLIVPLILVGVSMWCYDHKSIQHSLTHMSKMMTIDNNNDDEMRSVTLDDDNDFSIYDVSIMVSNNNNNKLWFWYYSSYNIVIKQLDKSEKITRRLHKLKDVDALIKFLDIQSMKFAVKKSSEISIIMINCNFAKKTLRIKLTLMNKKTRNLLFF